MTGTQVVVAKQALLSFLTALFPQPPNDTNPTVRYGAAGQIPRELIYIGHATSDQEPIAMRGGGRIARSEVVKAPVHIRIEQPGQDQAAVEMRAAQLSTAIEEAVAADPSLGGAVEAAFASTVDLPGGADDDGGYTQLTLTFLIKATLK